MPQVWVRVPPRLPLNKEDQERDERRLKVVIFTFGLMWDMREAGDLQRNSKLHGDVVPITMMNIAD